MDSGSLNPAVTLRRVGLRVTASRLAAHTALAASAPHSSVDAVVSAVRERLGDGSAQIVYNMPRAFTDVGLVRRIEPAGQPGLCSLRVGDNHHIVRPPATPSPMSTVRSATPRARRPPPTRAARSTKPRLSTGLMPRVCRGNGCLVWRLKVDTQRTAPAGRHGC